MARRREIAQRRHLSDEALVVHIRAAYAENRGAYGWPRIWRQLRAQGIRVGKQRVQRLMREHGIRARGKRRFRVTTTDSRHDLPIAPNLLNRNFTVAAPNQAWAGDITYIATEEGWLFLAVVIDLFSRRVHSPSNRTGSRLPDQRHPNEDPAGSPQHTGRVCCHPFATCPGPIPALHALLWLAGTAHKEADLSSRVCSARSAATTQASTTALG
jgi:hypothetical protein